MALGNLGVAFNPSNAPDTKVLPGGPDALSSAIQILSLHVPQFLGANAPVSRDLLTAPGSSGAPVDTNMVQQILRALLGGAPGAAGPSAPGAAPAPSAPPIPGGKVKPSIHYAPPPTALPRVGGEGNSRPDRSAPPRDDSAAPNFGATRGGMRSLDSVFANTGGPSSFGPGASTGAGAPSGGTGISLDSILQGLGL